MTIDREQLYAGSKELVERLADRLPEKDVESLLSLHDVGEPLFLLNILCAGLVKWQTPITPEERDALATLVVGVATTNDRFPYLADWDRTRAGLQVVGENA